MLYNYGMYTPMRRLAKNILYSAKENGIGKVKFAKIIYLTHKKLCQMNLASVDDITYIRMPLGPVPEGFMELSKDPDINVTTEPVGFGLSYNKQTFRLDEKTEVDEKNRTIIERTFQRISTVPTSELVNHTHEEDSWKNHSNGQTYKINEVDLERRLPSTRRKFIKLTIDEQRLQASLLEGMLDEIVDESTRLEYPDLSPRD